MKFAREKEPAASTAGVTVACVLFLFGALVLAQDGPESVMRGTKEFRKSVLVSGLAGPWELTWGPDNMLWVTERTGKRITADRSGIGAVPRHIAITIDEVSAPGSQDGLLGMALERDLSYVYAAYTYVDRSKGDNPAVAGMPAPYRYLYGKIASMHLPTIRPVHCWRYRST